MILAPGQVWRTDLDPTEGLEQAGVRPVLIVSTVFHLRLTAESLAVVVPLTTRERPGWDYRVPVSSGPRHSWAITEQPRTIATGRFLGDGPWWTVTDAELSGVVHALSRMLLAYRPRTT